ncbi:MAG TPA: hypothetical protein VK956_03000 [Verrucomicrobium sp.]|nr:hypothetical protein [Verrucomicrobium sp.]
MARISLIFGFLLVLLGTVSWGIAGFDATRITAFAFPAGFGTILILCGIIGGKFPGANKHVMHVAALIALLGAGGGISMAIKAASKGETTLKIATQGTLGVLCLVFLVLCVRSFIQARIARKQA